MRRLRRRMLHLLAGVLLACSVAAAASWAYSYRRRCWVSLVVRPNGYLVNIAAGRGQLQVSWSVLADLYLSYVPPGRFVFSFRAEEPIGLLAPVSFWTSLGFSYSTYPNRPGQHLVVPHWFVVLLAAPLPAWHFARGFSHRRRAKAGHCPRCAYDLTANTTGVCPECGGAVAARPAHAPPPAATLPPAV